MMQGLRQKVKTFIAGAWLGWQTESNWTDPLLFAIYSVIRPVSATLILVVMYKVVARGGTKEMFAYIYTGNAFFIYVGMVLMGIAWAVVEDREWYEIAKALFTAPIDYTFYLFGRGITKTLLATLSVIITLLFGVLFLGVSIPLSEVNWGYFLLIFLLGVLSLNGLGFFMAGVGVLVPRHSGILFEGAAGVFYLLAGAIYPIDILPRWLHPLSLSLPFTYWLEGLRRALLGTTQSAILQNIEILPLTALLLITALLFLLGGDIFLRFAVSRAKKKGILDRTTGY